MYDMIVYVHNYTKWKYIYIFKIIVHDMIVHVHIQNNSTLQKYSTWSI